MVITTVEHVKEWLRTNGAGSLPADEQAIVQAHAAAEGFIAARCRWATPAPPTELVLAVCILTARYLARRHTVTGLQGFDDVGVGVLPGSDPDVVRLMAPYRRVVFG